jgi:hypothetical protein
VVEFVTASTNTAILEEAHRPSAEAVEAPSHLLLDSRIGPECRESFSFSTRVLEKVVCEMTRFLKWRKMTWALLLWGALIGLWMISGSFVMALMAGVSGLIVLSAIWFMSRPLWRQGYGLRFRRIRSVEVPFKPVKPVEPAKSFGSSPS